MDSCKPIHFRGCNGAKQGVVTNPEIVEKGALAYDSNKYVIATITLPIEINKNVI